MGEGSYDWRSFMKRHWGAVGVFAAGAILAFAWAVYVFWWFTGDAQSTGLVPGVLSLWTMGHLLSFILYSIFWELLLVGVPVAIAAVAAWRWWKRLPVEERAGLRFGRHSRSKGGGGASLLICLAFALKVYLDGNWDVPISAFTVNYVVGSMITILEWAAVILGIPAAIALAWWVNREMRRP